MRTSSFPVIVPLCSGQPPVASAVAAHHHAAASGLRVQDGPNGRVAAEAVGQGSEHGVVGAADELAVPGGDAVEGAVAEPDGAVGVVVGLVAAGGQCLADRGQDLVLVALGHGPGRRFGSQVGAEGGGGAVERALGGAGGIGLDGAGEELGQGGVVAGGQAELELAVGADVVLGRAAGARPLAAAAPLVAGLEQAVVDELVEVIGGEWTADAGGVGGVVAADGDAAVGHVAVEGAADGIAQAGQVAELPVDVRRVHSFILKQMIIDSQPGNLYNKNMLSIEGDSMTTATTTFVIVGAGLAGAKAAETLRAEGFDGRLLLLGEEPERPYERPALSKAYLRGETDRDSLYVHQDAFYADNDIELRPSTPVRSIHPTIRQLQLATGERIGYRRLLLATGAAPRRLSLPGMDLDGVHYLRTRSDADTLAAAAARATQVAVVGTGWIGSEVAASLRQLGREVTLIGPDTAPLARVLGPEIGRVYRDLHADHGVRLLLETRVAGFRGRGRVEAVVTDDGRTIEADLVLVGAGAVPRTELAEAAGLPVGNGVLVNEQLEAVGAAGVYA